MLTVCQAYARSETITMNKAKAPPSSSSQSSCKNKQTGNDATMWYNQVFGLESNARMEDLGSGNLDEA